MTEPFVPSIPSGLPLSTKESEMRAITPVYRIIFVPSDSHRLYTTTTGNTVSTLSNNRGFSVMPNCTSNSGNPKLMKYL